MGVRTYRPLVAPPEQRVVYVRAGAAPAAPEPFVHVQADAATVWTISHPLDHPPAVTLIVGGEEVRSDVEYPAAGTVVVRFCRAVAGQAVLA